MYASKMEFMAMFSFAPVDRTFFAVTGVNPDVTTLKSSSEFPAMSSFPVAAASPRNLLF